MQSMIYNVEMTEVFRNNFKEEEARLMLLLSQYKTIAFDTEFPGMLDETPRDADQLQRYTDLKSNVERTKLIQVGFTLFNPSSGQVAGTWQFNMSGFNPKIHLQNPDSVRFLESCGIDLSDNLANGVRMSQFVGLLRKIRETYGDTIQWVTFHGLYDVGYLMVALARNRRLPNDIRGFARFAGDYFCGGIFDLKLMAGEFHKMGLERLAAVVGVTREQGRTHQAGSDSLLTAKLFIRAVRIMHQSGHSFFNYKGFLYGITLPIMPLLVPTRCYVYGLLPRVVLPNLIPHY